MARVAARRRRSVRAADGASASSGDAARLRVLHINTAKTWRGGERQTLFLATELARRGVEQLIVGQPGSELQARSEAAGLPFRAVAMRGELDLFAVAALRRAAREFGATVLHAHTARAHGLGLLARRGLPEARLVISRRVDFPARPNYFSRKKYLSPLIARYIAISENVRRILIADGVSPERIRIAYSGVDLGEYRARPNGARIRKELGLARNDLVIGNVAALVGHKDQSTLLKAFAALAAQLPRARTRLLIVGEGELRFALEAEARALSLLDSGRVLFTGFRRDIYDFFGAFDIFAMSSSEEGLGTSVLDAMAHGLPVVATNAGGLPEMVDPGRGGFLSPARDANAFANNLAALVKNAALRKKFGAYNKRRVVAFGSAATCEATLAIYREVLRESE